MKKVRSCNSSPTTELNLKYLLMMEILFCQQRCLKIVICCIGVVIILSLIESVVGIGDFRGSTAEESMKSIDYRWWLFITVLLSVSSIIERILDAANVRQTKIDKSDNAIRTLKILVVALPNIGILIALATATESTDYSALARIRNAIFVPQIIIVVSAMLSSTFGHCGFYGIDGMENLMRSIERSTVALLVAFIIRRSVLIALFAVKLNSSIFFYLYIGIECLMALVLLQVVYVTANLALALGRQMVGYKFPNYHQMHDFYRTVAVLTYISYNVATLLISGSSLSSINGYYEMTSATFVTLQIGQAGLIIVLGIIDSRSFLRRAEIIEEKLQVRLNMVRYISHEMRSPLNTAFMGLQLLHNDALKLLSYLKTALVPTTPVSGASRHMLSEHVPLVEAIIDTTDLVQESSNVALETLNDMLTFDKMDEKKLVIEVEEVDVWRFVCDTVRPFQINATNSNILLSIDCTDLDSRWVEDCRIKADRFKLNQVLRNFVSNALKFARSPGGEVKVLVEKRVVPQGKVVYSPGAELVSINNFVRISVTDNGCGISLENQRKLFGQYVQFNAGTLQKGGGSGLGLWISKSLVELHGGIIGVQCEGEGSGSTFFFELPLYAKTAEEDSNQSEMELARAETAQTSFLAAPKVSGFLAAKVHPVVASGDVESADDSSPSVAANAFKSAVDNFLLQIGMRNHSRYKVKAPKRTRMITAAAAADYNTLTAFLERPVILSEALRPAVDEHSIIGHDNTFAQRLGGNVILPSLSMRSIPSTPVVAAGLEAFTPRGVDDYSGVGGGGVEGFQSTASRHSRVNVGSVPFYDPMYSGLVLRSAPNTPAITVTINGNENLSVHDEKTGRQLSFLIVDDTMTSRKVTSRLLARLGNRVEEAVDGLDFLQKMGGTADNPVMKVVDVVLMDDNMPNLSGPDATEAIRQRGYRGLIIAVTGNGFASQVEHFLSKGADRVLMKPLNLQELDRIIQEKLPGTSLLTNDS